MNEEKVNEGQPETNGSEATDVKNEVPNEPQTENTEQTEQTGEPIEQPVEPVVEQPKVITDPDEKILNDMFESGKTEVETGELLTAGFDSSRIAQYSFSIGQFTLTRLLLVSPYKIDRKQ